MSELSTFSATNNLLADSQGVLSWLLQGKSWKHGGKLPVGWFITQWMQSEAAARANQVGIERSIQTEAGENYQFSVSLPKTIPAGGMFSVSWRGKTVASVSENRFRGGESLSFSLEGSGGLDQLRLTTNSDVDFGELNGFGLWRVPSHITKPLASQVSAIVGQTLVANTSTIQDADGLGSYSYQWQQRAKGSDQWVDLTGQNQANLTLEQGLVDAQLRVIVSYTDGGGTHEVLTSQATKVIAAGNRAPTVKQPTLLASGMEDGTVLITAVDLLANSEDADSDALSIRELRWLIAKGSSTAGCNKLEFTPVSDWNGQVELTTRFPTARPGFQQAAAFRLNR